MAKMIDRANGCSLPGLMQVSFLRDVRHATELVLQYDFGLELEGFPSSHCFQIVIRK